MIFLLALQPAHSSTNPTDAQSYSAFLILHAPYYREQFHEQLYYLWVQWHEKLAYGARRERKRQVAAAQCYYRSRSVWLTRPKTKKGIIAESGRVMTRSRSFGPQIELVAAQNLLRGWKRNEMQGVNLQQNFSTDRRTGPGLHDQVCSGPVG